MVKRLVFFVGLLLAASAPAKAAEGRAEDKYFRSRAFKEGLAQHQPAVEGLLSPEDLSAMIGRIKYLIKDGRLSLKPAQFNAEFDRLEKNPTSVTAGLSVLTTYVRLITPRCLSLMESARTTKDKRQKESMTHAGDALMAIETKLRGHVSALALAADISAARADYPKGPAEFDKALEREVSRKK